MIQPQKKFGWGAFIALMCCCGLGIFYLIYFPFKKSSCPMCNSHNWGAKPNPIISPNHQNITRYCQNYGSQVSNEFCTNCGEKVI